MAVGVEDGAFEGESRARSWVAEVVNRAVASPSASVTGTCAATVFDESSVSRFAVVEALLACVDVFVVMALDGGVTATHVAATSSTGSPSMALSRW